MKIALLAGAIAITGASCSSTSAPREPLPAPPIQMETLTIAPETPADTTWRETCYPSELPDGTPITICKRQPRY